MDKTEEYGTLAVFTALAPIAVGGLIGLLAVVGDHQGSGVDWAGVLVWMVGLLAISVSLLHLGRPLRAPLALRRVSTSWLSREVFLFGLFLVVLAAYVVLPVMNPGSLVRYVVGFAGVVIGLAGTIATGETYRLHSRPSWDQGLSVAAFPLGALSAGCLFGFFVGQRFGEGAVAPANAWVAVSFFLVSALVVSWLRSTRRLPESMETRLSRQLALGSHRWLLILRAAAVVVALFMVGMGGGAQFYAWLPALLGEFADRFLFFGTGVPVTLRSRYMSRARQGLRK